MLLRVGMATMAFALTRTAVVVGLTGAFRNGPERAVDSEESAPQPTVTLLVRSRPAVDP